MLIKTRIARPVTDLGRSAAFYGGLLALPQRDGFTGHEGYDGLFFALPGGAELELTRGPAAPAPGTEEDLLVLYVTSPAEVRGVADRLRADGVGEVPAANPYWARWGATFLDPDGYRVVIAAVDDGLSAGEVRVELYDGEREALRPLFELAEDSPAQLDSYLHEGRVLVAVTRAGEVVGHLQLTGTGAPGEVELTNMAVREDVRGRGVGRRLVQAAVDLAAAGSATRLLVATASADTGNLRFYQRQGFRLCAVERDAFTAATGYPPGTLIDGVELRDRVWLDRPLAGAAGPC